MMLALVYERIVLCSYEVEMIISVSTGVTVDVNVLVSVAVVDERTVL